eukprot:NODE_3969_length_1955_cov_1.819475.p1 GENE.NODE_3969_length_1955_cov_1.819475~~NODE_3969_length_1955_cov_1.819475.p1  ORF type:complete len:510 (+),score=161.19 NODE_3969_length_1955_cov_1.819475:173-1702(+)
MSKATLSLVAGLLSLASASQPSWWRLLAHERARKHGVAVPAPPAPQPHGAEQWNCEQLQDHFDAGNTQTWCQRYWVNTTHYRGAGHPVLICIGGEGPSFQPDVVSRSTHCNDLLELAPRVGAMVFALEHRFYGKSMPNVSDITTENLEKFLSSRQALADLARFHSYANKHYELKDAKWVTFGASYPGMLSSFARLLYPQLFHASVASSAPVLARMDFVGYHEVAARSLATMEYNVGGSALCLAVVRDGHNKIREMLQTAKGRRALEKHFNLCGENALDDERSVALWAGSGVIPLEIQGNDPTCSDENCNINMTCQSLIAASKPGSRMDALATVAQQFNGPDCMDVGYDAYLDELKSTDVTNWIRVWQFQTCKEFAFYQTCNEGSNCPYTQGYNTLAFNLDSCQKIFGISPSQVEANVAKSNAFYGGVRPNSTRVLFINGQVDPWHYPSVLVSPGPQLPTMWVPGASHHYWTRPSSATDTPEGRYAKEGIWAHVLNWLSEEDEEAPAFII